MLEETVLVPTSSTSTFEPQPTCTGETTFLPTLLPASPAWSWTTSLSQTQAACLLGAGWQGYMPPRGRLASRSLPYHHVHVPVHSGTEQTLGQGLYWGEMDLAPNQDSGLCGWGQAQLLPSSSSEHCLFLPHSCLSAQSVPVHQRPVRPHQTAV